MYRLTTLYQNDMTANNKEKIVHLLKGIETGDPSSVVVVIEDKYIQHNPQTEEGSIGLAELFRELAKTSPRVNVVRVFEDGDFVFAHTEYDFAERNIGFEIFRFEDGRAVEHWDNIQKRKGPNLAGHSMVDGVIDARDQERTELNRQTVRAFVERVLIGRNHVALNEFIREGEYTEHNPALSDDVTELTDHLSALTEDEMVVDYQVCHRVLADGGFVLSVCEGYHRQLHTSFFDLYRLEDGMIVEHWDTTETIPSRERWKNNNGKF
jgi:predicted SnoaL-like aldol condensation-catalyzing enzyme